MTMTLRTENIYKRAAAMMSWGEAEAAEAYFTVEVKRYPKVCWQPLYALTLRLAEFRR